MSKHSMAVVQTGPGKVSVRRFDLPRIGDDDALLRVERCGICGTDVEQFEGKLNWAPFPVIPGHEPLGIVEDIGSSASKLWGVEPGDRIAVESSIPCRSCRYCNSALFTVCPNRQNIGFVSSDTAPGLWGGYAEYLYLPRNAVVHKVSNTVSPDTAAMYNMLACGIAWGAQVPGTSLGDTVVVLGAGQRGIACALAAKAVGASVTAITGLESDRHKLSLALELGVDFAINVEREDLRARVSDISAGWGADIVIDAVPYAASTFVDAIDIVRVGGTVVAAGLKGDVAVDGFLSDKLPTKMVTIRGVYSKAPDAYRQAIALIESGRLPLEKLATHTFGLSQASHAIELLAGRHPGENPVFVSLDPTRN